MTSTGPDSAVTFIGMKPPISYIAGSVIVAIMFLAVFVGGANAVDFTRGQSAEAFAAKGHHLA